MDALPILEANEFAHRSRPARIASTSATAPVRAAA